MTPSLIMTCNQKTWFERWVFAITKEKKEVGNFREGAQGLGLDRCPPLKESLRNEIIMYCLIGSRDLGAVNKNSNVFYFGRAEFQHSR